MKSNGNRQGDNTMSNTATTTNSPTPIDSKKPQTKQELIAANIKLLIEQLEAGQSDALTNYLTAMSRFHSYSFGNVLEIARQMPTATRVAGFWTWKNIGRSVMAGQKGIRILAPIVGVRRKKDTEANKDITKQNERVLLGFRNAYVFDISQTDGIDLPALQEVTGDPGENIERLTAFLDSMGIQLVYSPSIAPALGMSYGGRIALLPGQSKAETFATLVHETAHELLHKSDRRTATTKTVRETEAEAVAFVVGKAVGLVNENASASYIQLYHGNASLLAESLEVIQQTASIILAALEPSTAGEAATDALAEVAA
jgi:N-terminal domain of anti-restriction factor ArdC